LDDLSTGRTDYCPRGVELIVGDVADPDLVAKSFRDIDGCFHLAAVASVARGNTDWLGTHRTNLSGAITVFDAARSAGRRPVPVVFASSAAVYGDPLEVPIAECAAPRPLSAYGADKLGCELHAYVASHVHHVPTCGLRFFNVYGPRQHPNSPYSGVISIFCNRLKHGEPVTVHGDGGQTRDFIYVGDVVRALLASMRFSSLDGSVINVCTGKATAVAELASAIGQLLGRTPEVTSAAPRPADIRHSVGHPGKAREVMGFLAEIGLAAGLARTLAAH
jgi:UDP-glucose 4-epimerase